MGYRLREARCLQRVRRLVDEGRLPVVVCQHVVAAFGSGVSSCACCGETIEPDEVEYEVRVPGGPPLQFHLRCHVTWQNEVTGRLKLSRCANATQSVVPPGRADPAVPTES